jgi:hypothetical protein
LFFFPLLSLLLFYLTRSSIHSLSLERPTTIEPNDWPADEITEPTRKINTNF